MHIKLILEILCWECEVRTKEERKKSPVGEEVRGPLMRERSKSEGRGKEALQSDGSGRSKFSSGKIMFYFLFFFNSVFLYGNR